MIKRSLVILEALKASNQAFEILLTMIKDEFARSVARTANDACIEAIELATEYMSIPIKEVCESCGNDVGFCESDCPIALHEEFIRKQDFGGSDER